MIYIKRQILVIENDMAICQAIYDSMQNNLTEVHYMTSAIEAMASYMTQDYCLVILDVQLADMDSIVLLRTMQNTKRVPILALTEPLTPKKIVALLHAGADTFLEKPLNIDVCIAQANKLIQR